MVRVRVNRSAANGVQCKFCRKYYMCAYICIGKYEIHLILHGYSFLHTFRCKNIYIKMILHVYVHTSTCRYMYIDVPIFIYFYIQIFMYKHLYIHVWTSLYMYNHKNIYFHTCLYMHLHVQNIPKYTVCIHIQKIYKFVCIYMFIYFDVHIHVYRWT